MTTDLIKGFRDYTGEEAQKRAEIKKVLAETFEKYSFEPAETPIIESEEFVRGENPSDEAVSDVYKLEDKGKRKLALRYEFTFQLKRLMQNKKLPYKRYQIGEVFRDEPVSANRLRQFVQCDIDTIGSTIKEDAEILALTNEVLKKLGIKFKIYFNNRGILNSFLDIFGLRDETKRKSVIIGLDKLDKKSIKEVREELSKVAPELGSYLTQLASTLNLKDLDKLKKYYQGICKNKKINYEQTLFAQAEKEIKELEKYLKMYNIKAEFSPSLARGLSYYNKNVFEIKTEQLKETIVGGGSYIFNGIQSTGISFGIDRLNSLAKIAVEKEKYLIISLSQDKEAIKLAEKLREKSKIVSLFYGKPSKALEYANSYNFSKVIFVGEEEIKKKKFKVKDMKSGKESLLKI